MKKGLRRSLFYIFCGGVSTSVVDTLVLGPTLLTYATFFGAGDITFGILGAIPYFGNLAHLLSAWFIEHNFSMRKTAFYTAFVSRFLLLIVALLAFIPNTPGSLEILILVLLLYYLIGCISGGIWLPWMKDLIPSSIMGRFFSFRFKYMMVAKIICFWGMALLLKYGPSFIPKDKEIFLYVLFFLIAFLVGLFSAWTLSQVEDKKQISTSSVPFLRKVQKCFKNKPFRTLLFTLCLANFTIAFITPFTTVFMLKYLDIPMSSILILTLIMQLNYVIVIRKLGEIADRKGTFSILKLSIFILLLPVISLLIINLLNPDLLGKYVILTFAHITLGVATAGITLGINNISLVYLPKESSAIYLSVNSIFKSFSGGVSSILAGIILSLCTLLEGKLYFQDTYGRWHIFWGISIVICIYTYRVVSVFTRSLSKSESGKNIF